MVPRQTWEWEWQKARARGRARHEASVCFTLQLHVVTGVKIINFVKQYIPWIANGEKKGANI